MKKIFTLFFIFLLSLYATSCYDPSSSNNDNKEANALAVDVDLPKVEKAIIWNDTDASMFVGYGVNILNNDPKVSAVTGSYYYSSDLADGEFEPTTLNVDYIENHSILEKILTNEVTIDCNGTFKKFTASANVYWKTSSDVTVTNDSIILYARQHVFIGKYGIDGAILTPNALNLLNNSVKNFINTYGHAYKKKSYVAADLIYIYKYTFNSTNINRMSEFKSKLKADVINIFGGSTDVTLTETDKQFISSLSKQIYAVTNVANYTISSIDSFDAWKTEEQRFSQYVTNSSNLKYLQSKLEVYGTFSDLANTPAEYTTILAQVLNYKTWQELWESHKNRITDILNTTKINSLKTQCSNALINISQQQNNIANYSSNSKAPANNEFQAIYNTVEIFGAFTLDGWGGIHTVGSLPTYSGAYWKNWDIAHGIELVTDENARIKGFYVLDGWGGVHPVGNVPSFTGGPYWYKWDIARDMAVVFDKTGAVKGYYILDGWGGVHPVGNVPSFTGGPYWSKWDIARKISAVFDKAGDVKGYYILDGYGGISAVGNVPGLSIGSWNWDIANDLEVVFDKTGSVKGCYVLDGWGGVHPAGNVPSFTGGPYWKKWDIARDITVVQDESGNVKGYYILDGYGGVHPVGNVVSLTDAPYWGWDIARILVINYRQ